MSGQDEDILGPFIAEIEPAYINRGGVSCAELLGGGGLGAEPLLDELVFSMLMWESSIDNALRSAQRIREELVDLNELRVCTCDELAVILGSRTARGKERAHRLIGMLHSIYERENRLSLASLREMNKRDVQEYLVGISGLPPYAVGRLVLLGLDWHAFPIDERLNRLLIAGGLCDSGLDPAQQTQRLERVVRASDAKKYYTLIEHWSQSQRSPRAGGSASRRSRSRSGASRATPKGSS